MNTRLTDTTRSALVTGASRGIGYGIARRLAEHGFHLTITARDAERLATVADEFREFGAPEVVTVAADIGSDSAATDLATAHRERYTSMDALVLNAGVGTAGPIAEFPRRRYDKTLAVNLTAPFALLQECLPMLREAAAANPHGAKVIALSSITGVYAEPNLAVYGAAKAALNSLMDTLNAEESAAGVTGTAIAPAFVNTDMSAWTQDTIPPETMISVDDIVEVSDMVLRLSRSAVIPRVVVGRAGTNGYQA
jgi:3-oxoacyl-[acyl-carrier protein] reductase